LSDPFFDAAAEGLRDRARMTIRTDLGEEARAPRKLAADFA